MSEATYVTYVPKSLRERLRATLEAEDTGAVTWHEKKLRQGSEFYFSGPAGLVRKTHAFIASWVASSSLRPAP